MEGLGFIVAGGSTSVTSKRPSRDCFLYDVYADTWSELPKLLTPAECASAVAINHNVHVLGGLDERGDVMECLSLDADVEQWQTCAPMLRMCASPIAAVLNNKIYVLFNTTYENIKHGNYIVSLACFHPHKNEWSVCCSLPKGTVNTEGASLTPCNDKLFLIGGADRLCMSFSPHQNLWTLLEKPQTVQWKAAAISIKEGIILMGGKLGEMGGQDAKEVAEETMPDREEMALYSGSYQGLTKLYQSTGTSHQNLMTSSQGSVTSVQEAMTSEQEIVTSDQIEIYHVKKNEWKLMSAKLPVPLWNHVCFKGD